MTNLQKAGWQAHCLGLLKICLRVSNKKLLDNSSGVAATSAAVVVVSAAAIIAAASAATVATSSAAFSGKHVDHFLDFSIRGRARLGDSPHEVKVFPSKRVVEVHAYAVVLDFHDSPVQVVAVAVDHRQDVADKHALGVKLAVDFEEVFRQVKDVCRVDFSVGICHRDDKVELVALVQLCNIFLESLQCDTHAGDELEGMFGRGLLDHAFFTSVFDIQLVGDGDVFV